MQGKTSLTKEDIAAVFSLYDRVSLIIPHKKNQLTTKIQSSIKTCCTLNIYWQFIKVDFLAFIMSLVNHVCRTREKFWTRHLPLNIGYFEVFHHIAL